MSGLSIACRIVIALACAVVCAGCTMPGVDSAAPTVTPTAVKLEPPTTPIPTIAIVQPTPAGTLPTATVLPVTQPTQPVATVPPAAGLIGPEWTIAAAGDVNFDTRPDVIAYKPATVVPRQPNADYPITAAEIVIVQQGASGQPEIQLAINLQGVVSTQQQIVGYPAGAGPAGFQARVAAGSGVPLSIIPLTAGGDPYAQGSGFAWNGAAQSYQAVGLPIAPGPSTGGGVPLVGPEWTIVTQGDSNGNGRRDVIAYRPGGIAPQRPDPAYPLVVSEVVIVEEGLLGRSELQLSVNTRQIVAPGRSLATYPSDRPAAAFQATINPGSGIVVGFIPLDSAGAAIARGGRIIWDGAAQGFRLTADSEAAPVPRQLVGAEWTIIADGDANGDGRRDVLAFKPSSIVPRQPTAGYQRVAAEVVIVQANAAGPYGDPEIQLAINTQQIFAPGVSLFNYATTDPARVVAAFQLNAAPGSGVPVSIIPINAAGNTISGLNVGATWDRVQQAYRLIPGGGQPGTPPPTVTATPARPLVGAEWTVFREGDHNGDGRRDVVAYKPAGVSPRQANPALPLVVSEAVVVQENAAGQGELLLSIAPLRIIVPGQTLWDYSSTSVAGFQISVGSAGAIDLTPLNSAGDAAGPPQRLSWVAEQAGYRLATGTPRAVPQQAVGASGALVGPEWTVVSDGDINGDGRRDILAYKGGSVQPAVPDPDFPLVVSEAVVVQAGASGQPELFLSITTNQISVPGRTLLDFGRVPSSAPAAFQMRFDPASGVPIRLRGINTSGGATGQSFGITWDRSSTLFGLVGGPAPAPTAPVATPQAVPAAAPTTAPAAQGQILGPEWTIIGQGDYNGDGIPDVVGYKPASAVTPAQANPALPYVATEVTIAQRRADGQVETLLTLTTATMSAPGIVLRDFVASGQAVTAFQVGVTSGAAPLTIVPLSNTGQPIGESIGVAWNAEQRGFRLAPGTP